MADEPHVIRGINWRETFPFINIFRAFRIAIHPSKLVLALLALLTLYFGGRILDGLWVNKHKAVPGEIALYETSRDSTQYDQRREDIRKRAADIYAGFLTRLNKQEERYKYLNDITKARPDALEGKHTRHVRYWIEH